MLAVKASEVFVYVDGGWSKRVGSGICKLLEGKDFILVCLNFIDE